MADGRRERRSTVWLTFALIGILLAACGEASLPSSSLRHSEPDADGVETCPADEVMEFALPGPGSLEEMMARADLLAEVEIIDQYERPGGESLDEVISMEMATAAVRTPIVGAIANQEITLYVATVASSLDGGPGWVVGDHASETLVPGTRLITALDEDAPEQYELTGGDLLFGPNGTLSVLGSGDCPTTEEVALSEDIAERSASDVIAELKSERETSSPVDDSVSSGVRLPSTD